MRILIAEDDFASRKVMSRFLSKYGECDITVDGREAVTAFSMALDSDERYDLCCLDIMMPEMDGYEVLKAIREMEREKNITEDQQTKIIMTTALSDKRNVDKAFDLGAVAYAGKPISQSKFESELVKLGLIDQVSK